MARPIKNTAWNEVFALVLLGVGTLLFLALISYDSRDLPSWVPFSHVSPPNRPVQNFIGPFGAIIAGLGYFMIGAASYLLAVVLLGFGGAKLFNPKLRVTPRTGWIETIWKFQDPSSTPLKATDRDAVLVCLSVGMESGLWSNR